MKAFQAWSVRAYLTFLLALALVPALGIILYSGWEHSARAQRHAELDCSVLTQNLAAHQRLITANTRQILSLLAELPELKSLNTSMCSAIFRDIERQNPLFAVLFLASPQGQVMAASSPLPQPIAILDRKYYRDLLKTRAFSVGEFVISRTTQKRVLHFAYPVLSAQKELLGMVVAGVDLAALDRLFEASGLPREISLVLLDHAGIVLPHSGTYAPEIGRPESSALFQPMTGRDDNGSFTALGPDGSSRHFTYQRLALQPGAPSYLYIRVGFSETPAMAAARASRQRDLGLAALFALFALGIAWLGKAILSARERDNQLARQALAKSEEQFRALFNNMSEGVALHRTVYNAQGLPVNYELLDVNPQYETILSLKRSAVIGKLATDVYGTPDPPYLRAFTQVGETGQPCFFETFFPPMDRHFAISVARLKPGYWATIFFDITSRKRAEEETSHHAELLEVKVRQRTAQLEAANQELEAFSYSISHDLKAPLRHISGFVDLLVERVGPQLDAEGRRLFEIIAKSSAKMAQLIEDLLLFSRMGRASMRLMRIDQDALVSEIVREIGRDHPQRQIQWEISALPEAQADLNLWRQVWVNLIENAAKYSRPREMARIEIGWKPGGPDEDVFFVRDNGVGFNMQYVAKLFGVFQRLHSEEQFEGTGIGLANVRRIVNRHGGRVWAESIQGQGATFFFSLPRNSAAMDIAGAQDI